MTTYPLSAEDREIQERARRFVDEELIPWEEHAEAQRRPASPRTSARKHHDRAIELGFYAMNMPKELGGSGHDHPAAGARSPSRSGGSRTRSAGASTRRPRGRRPSSSDHQMQTWILPTIRGERHECYAITEAGAGSDVDAIEATARRDGDEYVLNGEKMHVTSYNGADLLLLPGEDRRRAARGRARDVLRRQGHAGRAARARAAPTRTRTPTRTPIVAFDDVRVPAANLIGAGGRRHGVHVRVVPLRAADDRRTLLRRGRAADRRGHRVRAAARAVRRSRSSSTRRSRTCSPTRSPSCGPRA